MARGYLTEGRGWCDQLVGSPRVFAEASGAVGDLLLPESESAVFFRAVWVTAALPFMQGDYEASRAVAGAGVRAARETHDLTALGLLLRDGGRRRGEPRGV